MPVYASEYWTGRAENVQDGVRAACEKESFPVCFVLSSWFMEASWRLRANFWTVGVGTSVPLV